MLVEERNLRETLHAVDVHLQSIVKSPGKLAVSLHARAVFFVCGNLLFSHKATGIILVILRFP